MEVELIPETDILLVLCVTVGIAILINVGIISIFRKGDKKRETPFKVFRQVLNNVRNPWEKENEQIEELSSILDSLKKDINKGDKN